MFLALAGGVGGSKLAFGLQEALGKSLTVVVNTGDDFQHFGLAISPDLDTVMYTLAGLNNKDLGWGLEGETWQFMDAIQKLGEDNWFQLGDRDLATHVVRSWSLASGSSLSQITEQLCQKFGVRATVAPMSDQHVSTIIETVEGSISFQEYFVKEQCNPKVRAIHFDGIDTATASPQFLNSLASPKLEAVIICPSNPFLSIDPILAIPGIRTKLIELKAPVIAVSPLIGGRAVKGPTGKLFEELALEASAYGVANRYSDIIDGFVLDNEDAALEPSIRSLGIKTLCTNTLMRNDDDKASLGRKTIRFARSLRDSK